MTGIDDGQPDAATETAQKAMAAADQRAALLGRVFALMMSSQRHHPLTIAEINAYVTPAVALGQIAMIGARKSETDPVAMAGVVWWAMVSPEVDQRLSESRDPFLKLEANDWRSGDQPWIVDAIGSPKVVNELLKRLMERNFSNHPAKMRAILPDGRMAVGRLEQRPANPADGGTAS